MIIGLLLCPAKGTRHIFSISYFLHVWQKHTEGTDHKLQMTVPYRISLNVRETSDLVHRCSVCQGAPCAYAFVYEYNQVQASIGEATNWSDFSKEPSAMGFLDGLTNVQDVAGSNLRDGLALMPHSSNDEAWAKFVKNGIKELVNREYTPQNESGPRNTGFFALSYRHNSKEVPLLLEEQITELRRILRYLETEHSFATIFVWIDSMYMKYHKRRPANEGNDWVRFGLAPYKGLPVIELSSRENYEERLEERGWISLERALAHRNFGHVYWDEEVRKVRFGKPTHRICPVFIMVQRGLVPGEKFEFSRSGDKEEVQDVLMEAIVSMTPNLSFGWRHLRNGLYLHKSKRRAVDLWQAAHHWNSTLGMQYYNWVHEEMDSKTKWYVIESTTGLHVVAVYKTFIEHPLLISIQETSASGTLTTQCSTKIYNSRKENIEGIKNILFKESRIVDVRYGCIGLKASF